MPERGGLWGKALDLAEAKTGLAVIPKHDLELKEAAWDELRQVNRELDLLGWHVLDYLGGQPQEITTQSRRRMVQRSRYVWMNDPQAGASVSLMTDFTFGRGVPKPSAKDKTVQDVLDAFWTDPDNKRALTTYSKQVQLSTDLSLQSNIWFQVFDDGDDGKVKLSLVDHDTVENCVRDPQNPSRVLYWVIRPRPYAWDFSMDRPDTSIAAMQSKPLYYEDWSGLQEAKEEETAGTRQKPIPTAPEGRTGDGRVYHIAINRYSGQQFGVPEMQRTIRWFSAYNDFMKARVDIAQASAAFIMKRKVKGTPSQLARLASKAISKSGEISGGTLDESGTMLAPPKVGSIINENDSVSHENFNLNSGAGNAQMDAHMIRAPISAATRWPQSYLGDESNSSLATATSLELPVLKAVESRQEVFEEMIRAMVDLVIERAVDTGTISEERTPEEILDVLQPAIRAQLAAGAVQLHSRGLELLESQSVVVGSQAEGYTLRVSYTYEDEDGQLQEGHEDKAVDEEDTKRDLGYEFSMPSPLRRMMGDLVTACQTIAATFDPNNTNTELTRALATIVFGEALEIEDPADLVEKIWPPGYQDPLMAAQLQASQPTQQNPFSPDAASEPFPGQPDNPMNAISQRNQDPGSTGTQFSQLPEQLRSGPYNAMEATRLLGEAVHAGDGVLAAQLTAYLQEALRSKDDLFQSRVRSRQEVVDQLFDEDVTAVAMNALSAVPGSG